MPNDLITTQPTSPIPTIADATFGASPTFSRQDVYQAIIEGVYLDKAGVMIVNGSRVYPKRGDLRVMGDTIEYHWQGTNEYWVPLHESSIHSRARIENLAFADEPPLDPEDTKPIPPIPPAPLPKLAFDRSPDGKQSDPTGTYVISARRGYILYVAGYWIMAATKPTVLKAMAQSIHDMGGIDKFNALAWAQQHKLRRDAQTRLTEEN